ncbi:hypothetical protein [Saccharicrinis sp. FJH54]|uniref:hypothetical protein n=1 Tax=Saccharicrinis sp. FJH54 TaxID=3344665 RepID=UPI0035D48EA2
MIKRRNRIVLINSEGDLLSVIINQRGQLYIEATLLNNNQKIINETNKNKIELYLKGRITLQSLLLLSSDGHYIFPNNKENGTAKFIEINLGMHQSELSSIIYGNELYPLLPDSMKPNLSIHEILEFLPEKWNVWESMKLEKYEIANAGYTIFKDNDDIQIVEFEHELINPDEYYFLKCRLNQNQTLMIRLIPESLKLYINQITLADLIDISDSFILDTDNQIICSYNQTQHIQLIKRTWLCNRSYYQLPHRLRVENPLGCLKNLQDSTINGRGILSGDFRRDFTIDLNTIYG